MAKNVSASGSGKMQQQSVVVGDAEYWQQFLRHKAIEEALKPLDRVAAEMEGKWGCARLPSLVSPELAAKFGAAAQKLDEAINHNDVEQVPHKAAVMIRGWGALDEAARAAGASQMPENTWSLVYENKRYTVVLNRADVDGVARNEDKTKPAIIVTLNELLMCYEEFRGSKTVSVLKEMFPGAEMTKIRKVTEEELDDEIPF